MSRGASAGAGRCTCTACGLVCEDIGAAAEGFPRACAAGALALAADVGAVAPAHRGPADSPPAHSPPNDSPDGRPLSRTAAIAAAAAALADARRVLVTGFGGATLEAVARACDVAEALGAAIDAGAADCDRPAGPTIARAGEVTAEWEELRDRADLVIFWECDPTATHPRFIERFVAPLPAAGARRVLVVGRPWPVPPAVPHEPVPLAPAAAVDAAREVQTILGGRHLPRTVSRAAGSAAAAAERIAAAIDAARCVAVVAADDDPTGLAGWSLAHLVRTIAHVKPAFAAPLGGPGPAGLRSAAAVCTWRYAAAGAIDRADGGVSDRGPAGRERLERSPVFLPGEASARRLIERGEVDAVLVAGRAVAAVESALQSAVAAAGPMRIVRIDDDVAPAGHGTIRLVCASLCGETDGTMLRGDGRTVRLVPPRGPRLPLLADVLTDLLAAIRGRRSPHDSAAATAGGFPAGAAR